jgi:hypothetical protein
MIVFYLIKIDLFHTIINDILLILLTIIMTCVLDILSIEDLYIRKENLLKQIKKVDDEIIKRNIKKETTRYSVDSSLFSEKQSSSENIFKNEVIKLIKVKKKSNNTDINRNVNESSSLFSEELCSNENTDINRNVNESSSLFSFEQSSSENTEKNQIFSLDSSLFSGVNTLVNTENNQNEMNVSRYFSDFMKENISISLEKIDKKHIRIKVKKK